MNVFGGPQISVVRTQRVTRQRNGLASRSCLEDVDAYLRRDAGFHLSSFRLWKQSNLLGSRLWHDSDTTVSLLQWDSFEAVYTYQYATHNPNILIKFEVIENN